MPRVALKLSRSGAHCHLPIGISNAATVGLLPIHDSWYEIPDGPALRQGDIFRRLLVLWLPQELPLFDKVRPEQKLPVEPEWDIGDWIVMSASCDVDRPNGYPHVLLGRVLPAIPQNFGLQDDGKEFQRRLEVVRKSLDPSRFLLAEHPRAEPPFPLSIVQFRVHVTMPIDYLRRAPVGGRLRLRHPLRESFGNWVGANISRVGPENAVLIPGFGIATWPTDVLRAAEDA